MSATKKHKSDVEPVNSQLAERDVRILLVLCAELVNFCATVTREIDPTASVMLAYVRDDIRFENKSLLP
jgi:hypothetical protein